ncbi:hypothetical protein [Ramlibacter sp.]|uniref:hypothetical protein n=1 Tax=Ramlibacter sp. TaxID=1917967 RepID=UPI0035B281FA
MVLPVTQRAFTERHAAWLRADAEACAAERDIAAALDRYCEGQGCAPPLAQSAAARCLRLRAGEAWGALLAEIDAARRCRPLI